MNIAACLLACLESHGTAGTTLSVGNQPIAWKVHTHSKTETHEFEGSSLEIGLMISNEKYT